MRSFLNKVLLLTLDGLTKESCIAAYLRCAWVGLVKKSGLLFTWFSLKQCSSSSLQIAYGGQYTPQLLPTPVPVPSECNVSGTSERNYLAHLLAFLPSLSHSETALSLLTSTAVSTVVTRASTICSTDLRKVYRKYQSKGNYGSNRPAYDPLGWMLLFIRISEMFMLLGN